MLIELKHLVDILGEPSYSFPFNNTELSVLTDSRSIEQVDIFFTLVGENFDAHDFLLEMNENQEAKQKIKAIVLQKNHKHLVGKLSFPCFVVEDTTQKFLELATWYGSLFDIPKVMITGSNGKTTVKNCLDFVLKNNLTAKQVLASYRNYNNKIGVAKTLFQLRVEHKVAVFEVGTNSPGEIFPLAQAINPQIIILTSVGESHLQNFKTVENVYREKTSFLSFFKGILIANGDDSYLQKIDNDKNQFELALVGQECSNSVITFKNIKFDNLMRSSFELENQTIQAQIPGRYQVNNYGLVYICCLKLVSLGFKFDFSQIAQSLSLFKSDSMRSCFIEKNQITILNDCYNANPTSMLAALEIISQSQIQGKKVAILGEMAELGTQSEQKHFEVGEYVALQKIDFLFYLVGSSVTHHYAKGAQQTGISTTCIIKCSSIEQLLIQVKQRVNAGDLLLVKGSRSSGLERFVDEF